MEFSVHFGRRQNEFDVFWRFFQCLQHGIEGRIRKHMHFVDDIDLEPPTRWCINGIFEKLPHFIDFGIGRRVTFEQIDKAARIDFST